jgi:predicted dehydrogenase
MLDMGPYYLTALVNLMGGIKRVAGIARTTFPTRTITSQPKSGTEIQVETPTHITGSVEFASGALGMVVQSFDIWHGQFAPLIVHGTEGSLLVGDPNSFGDQVRMRGRSDTEWEVVGQHHGFAENSRGVGLADMAIAIRSGRPHRASGALARHVLDITLAVFESSREGRHAEITAPVERPAPLPLGLHFGQLDQ